MAGVHIELRKILSRDSFSSTLWAYLYAGINSAGPLILSIVGILILGSISLWAVDQPTYINQFYVSVTYLFAASLVTTGAVQLFFTRYISDQLFERRRENILPSFNAICLLTTLITGVTGLVLAFTLFSGESALYRVLMMTSYVVLSNIWIGVTFLASIKRYSTIIKGFLLGYLIVLLMALVLSSHGLPGLLTGFVGGHFVLLLFMLVLIHRDYPSQTYICGSIFDRKASYPILIFVGLLFNIGIWADKFMFWFSEAGQRVIGPLHASVIYDIPIFIAYLCIIPGMAILLLRVETGFTRQYDAFYKAVRNGGSLGVIRMHRDEMVVAARSCIYDIFKIQAVVVLLIFAFGDTLLNVLGVSSLYFPLLKIDVIGVSLQMLLLGILNFMFYLDKRRHALLLTFLFAAFNILLTWLTLQLGPSYYGYGFAVALLLTVIPGMYLLDRRFDQLEYEVYMLQDNASTV